jgi:hypothetical protein
MFRQVEAVLMTYATRRSLWLMFGLGLLFIGAPTLVMITSMHGNSERDTQAAVYLLGFAAGGVGYVLLSQAKWQFADMRARVLPGFKLPHLTVAACLGAVGLVLWPLFVALLGGFNSLGCVACALAIAVPYLWGSHLNRIGLAVPGFVAFLSLMPEAGRRFWLRAAETNQVTAIHWGIVIAATAAFGAWIARLANLREEMDDYNIPVQVQAGSATRLEKSQANRNLARHFARHSLSRSFSDAWLDRLKGRREDSVAGRQRLFRYGFAPLPLEVQCTIMAVAMGGMMLLCALLIRGQATDASWSTMPIVMFGMWPMLSVSQLLAMRRARMAQELMLPLSRTEFIDGVLGVCLRTGVTMWLILHILLALALLFTSSPLPPAATTWVLVAASLSVQPYMFGVNVLVARHPSGTTRLGLMMVAIFPGLIAGACIFGLSKLNVPAAMALAVLVALLGVWLCQSARKAWLNLELV